jgi:hypothetical protein
VSKVRRGGFVFVTWKGDHEPRHVHVYRDGRLIVRWNLDTWRPMKGAASARIRSILEQLRLEGRL